MNYSEEQLVNLAQNNTQELVRLLSNPNEKITTLTSGTEIISSEICDENIVLPILRKLLKHINALVRESAIIGIETFYNNRVPPQDIMDKLSDIYKNDPSKNMKSFAKDLLETYSKLK